MRHQAIKNKIDIMKKITLLSLILSVCYLNIAKAEIGKGKSNPWIDIGLKGSYGITSLYNNNLLNEKNLQYSLSTGYSAGLKLGFNLNTVLALNIEAVMTQLGQKYQGTHQDFRDWKNNVKLNYFEFPVLLKITKNEWSFVELGIKTSMLKAAIDSEGDVSNFFNNSNFSVIFGFGQTLFASNGLYVSMGPRFTYGFSDLISENGKAANFPFPAGKFSSASAGQEYKPTNSISASMQLNIDFDLGQLAKASCGRGSKFVLFKN